MSLGLVVPVGNWQRGSCPTGVIVLQVSCPWGIVVPRVVVLGVVVPRVVVLGVVVPRVVVLEPTVWCLFSYLTGTSEYNFQDNIHRLLFHTSCISMDNHRNSVEIELFPFSN